MADNAVAVPVSTTALLDPAATLYPVDEAGKMMKWLVRPDVEATLAKAGLTRTALYQVRADSEVSQCLETRADALAAVPWRLEPVSHPWSLPLTEGLEPWWDRIVRGIADAVPYGYSVVQLAMDQTGQWPMVTGALEQPFEEFKINQGGEWRRFPLAGGGGTDGLAVDPLTTMITVRQPTGKTPYGSALLSALYWPVYFKREGLIAWLKFVERFGTPIPIGKVNNPQAFVAAMNAAGFDTAFGVSPQESIEALLTSHGGELERMQEQLIRVIQRVILGQTLTSDMGSTGSYAAAKVHDLVREDKRNADVRLAKASIQSWLNRLLASQSQTPLRLIMADDTGLEQDRAVRDATLQPVLIASRLQLTAGYFTDRYDLRPSDLTEAELSKVTVSTVPGGEDPPEPPPSVPATQPPVDEP